MQTPIRIFACLVLLLATGATLADKTAGQVVDDTWIHTKVKTALVGFGTTEINIEVYHGVVQLAGFVKSDTDRQAAARQAASVSGVVEVRNRLVSQPAPRSAGQLLDDGIMAGEVKSALADDDRTSAFDINVEVRNAVVLLSGFVDSVGEAQIAMEVARAQDNVQDVINGMDVKPDK